MRAQLGACLADAEVEEWRVTAAWIKTPEAAPSRVLSHSQQMPLHQVEEPGRAGLACVPGDRQTGRRSGHSATAASSRLEVLAPRPTVFSAVSYMCHPSSSHLQGGAPSLLKIYPQVLLRDGRCTPKLLY